MTHHPDWASLRNSLVDAYGDPPHPATEADIVKAYEAHPAALEQAAHQVAADVKAGTARSGWGVLRARANQLTTPTTNPTRHSGIQREKRITAASQWMRAAGKHYDRPIEVEDALTQAQLRDHPDAIPQLLELWREVRPEGEQIERDALLRAETWKATQAKLKQHLHAVETEEPKPL